MNNIDVKDALTALRSAPGPAPWYVTQPPLRTDESLRWTVPTERGGRYLESLLLDTSGAVLLSLPMYSCAQLLGPSRLFCSSGSKDGIVIRLFDSNSFHTPLANSISAIFDKAAQGDSEMMWGSGLVWEGIISSDFQDGRCSYQFPPLLEDVDEVLFFGDTDGYRLYRLLPKRHEIAVHPQSWFNEGDYDFGYQWPMLVTREQKSKAVVGYGLRLGVFILDSTLSNVEQWLREDLFAYYLNPNP